MSKYRAPKHFYGQSLKRVETGGISLVESQYRPLQKNPRHEHADPTFCLVIQGGFTELHQGRATTCEPATLLYYPAGDSHEDHFQTTGGRCLIVEVKPFWVERLREHSASLDQAAQFHGQLSAIALKLYHELRLIDESSPLLIESLALEMLAVASRCLRRSRDSVPRPLHHAREMIHEHFSERLTLDEIGRAVGLHPVYLAGEFRRRFHCTVGEYVRELRIEFACRRLANSRESLAGIAAAAGFFDQSHFTRTFKRTIGMTPSEYRCAFVTPGSYKS